MSLFRSFFRDRDSEGQRGQSLVEFALLLPLMLLIITGLFVVARAVWEENTLAYAAREGTRYAIVHGSSATDPSTNASTAIAWCVSCTDPTVTQIVTNAAIGVPNITVTLTYPDSSNDRGKQVGVEVTAPFVPLPSQYLLNGALTVTLRGGSVLVIQR